MKRILFSSLVAVALISAGSAYAAAVPFGPGDPNGANFTLQTNAQCVGGTQVTTFQRTVDGGAADTGEQAKTFAEYECGRSTPSNAFCSVRILTYPASQLAGTLGNLYLPGFSVFNYTILTGATIQPKSSEQQGTARVTYFAGQTATVPPTASLVANPSSIPAGGQSVLTWSSTGAATCSSTSFSTGGTTSGSVTVSPSQTTTYSVSCTGAGGSASASASVAIQASANNPSPGGPLLASCRVSPSTAEVGETVAWTSTVSGGSGSYSYSWSGTDNLSGSASQISRAYTTTGQKTASLTVTDNATGSGTGYAYVQGKPYFTKVCSGGTNGKAIQQPNCSDTNYQCTAAELGKKCKVTYDDDACSSFTLGFEGGDGPNSVAPTIYSWVTDYRCQAVGPAAQSVTVQCENALTVGNTGHPGVPQCSDGVDNDRDGRIDAADAGCGGGGQYDPTGDSEAGDPERKPQCSDGIDNNGDGTVDYPEDLGCSSANDDLELIDPAEVNFTASPPLIKKDQSCTLKLSALRVKSCSLTGPGVTRSFQGVGGVVNLSEVVTPALAQTSAYTLSCVGLNGKTTTKNVDCKIAPTFEEF